MRTIRLSQKQTNYPPNKIHSLGNDIKQYFTLEYRNIKLRQRILKTYIFQILFIKLSHCNYINMQEKSRLRMFI